MEKAAQGQEESHARKALTLIRAARTASLATLERGSGMPYASLVTVATDAAGMPLLLISKLALHTQNLIADPRASLLFDGAGIAGQGLAADPLALGRVTAIGRIEPVAGPNVRARYLARHPSAAMYADFADFAFYGMHIERAHFIGGFGRIVDLPGKDLVLAPQLAERFATAEADIIAHMNADHAEALGLYATRLLGAPAGDWRMTGLDPHGLDMVSGSAAARLWFEHPVNTPDEVRVALAGLARKARASGAA